MENHLSLGHVFFDTEFANFGTFAPLSIGVVSEDTKIEFYKEVSDFDLNVCSDFVKQTVVPLMDLDIHGEPYAEVSQSLIKWINHLPFNQVLFVADYTGDVVILERLLSLSGEVKLEKKVSTQLIKKAFLQAMHERGLYNHKSINKAFEALNNGIHDALHEDPAMRHHALYDAHANLKGWIKGINRLK